MSTVLATLSAASMRLGQPTYVDISGRMGDIVLGILKANFAKWVTALEAESHGEAAFEAINTVEYATKAVSPDHYSYKIVSAF